MLDNGNSSTCYSMVAVVGMSKQPVEDVVDDCAARPLQNNKRKLSTVTFNEDTNEFHSNTEVCKEDCKHLWYTRSDYRNFKESNRCHVKEIAKHEKLFYSSPSSYQHTMLRTYEACRECQFETVDSVLTLGQERNLRHWMDLSTARLGLERSSIREISRDRSYRRKDIVQAVMESQDEMEQSEASLVCDDDARAQSLRQTSEAISRPSRLFARQLARAQQAADPFF